MAYDKEIFSYNDLCKFIYKSEDPILKQLFDTIKTSNFELIMRELELCKKIMKSFNADDELINKIDESEFKLKFELINAVKEMHPRHVFTISETKSDICAKFLNPFLQNGGKIFSTNYDILLYWILMRNENIKSNDGFGRFKIEEGQDNQEAIYSDLIWGENKNGQNTFYLHGALPLFDTGIEIIKEQYSKVSNEYILEKIKERINKLQYPIFVTAGNGEEKLNHIMHNKYLSNCYDSLCSIKGSLVSFGFNFGSYDEHIIEAINKAAMKSDYNNKLWSIYIGVYNDDDIKHIESIKDKFKCKVHIFDSNTAHVWE